MVHRNKNSFKYNTKIKINCDSMEAHVSKMKFFDDSVKNQKTMEKYLNADL